MNEVTRILSAIQQGDPRASEQLLPLVYDELRRLAAAKLAHEKPGQTLQATALVHEAYLRLVARGGRPPGDARPDDPFHDAEAPDAVVWNSRGHFLAAAAEAMRRILVENARRKQTEKYGGKRRRIDLSQAEPIADADPDALLDLDEALTLLAAEDAAAAEVAKLRLFAGLSVEEAAQALSTSRANAYRQWAYARAWLHARLRQQQ
jgi:ECF sigma factor